jgi:uncharacterized protein (DUF2267 family)
VDHREFVLRVRQRARLDSYEQAEVVCRVVLAALGERLTSRDLDRLAAQLPEPLGAAARAPDARLVELHQFLHRVGDSDSHASPAVRRHAQSVLQTVAEALHDDELQVVLAHLPDRLVRLFEVHPPAEARVPRPRRAFPAEGDADGGSGRREQWIAAADAAYTHVVRTGSLSGPADPASPVG